MINDNKLLRYIGTDKNVDINKSIKEICDNAFDGCNTVEKVTFTGNSSVTRIGNYAFRNCANLKKIAIPSTVTSIGGWAFAGCKLETIWIPNTVAVAGGYVFLGCDNLGTIYCEAASQPEKWHSKWNYENKTVVWGSATATNEKTANTVNIYAYGNTIVVEDASEEIFVYTAMGRLVGRTRIDAAHHASTTTITVTTPGVYIVKVGSVAKRVMIN